MKNRNRLHTWDTAPAAVHRQGEEVAAVFKERLGDALTGVYLHGSLVLGAFAEGVSDLDLLVVTAERLPRGIRLELAGALLALDRQPCSLELSALYRGDLHPWRHPVRCQFHYSAAWAGTYRKLLSGRQGACFLVDTDFEDPDIVCHVRLTRESGVLLNGEPVAEVFPDVPEADFWDSLCRGVEEFDFEDYGSRMVPSQILTLGRIWSYRQERRILSKYEAGGSPAPGPNTASTPLVMSPPVCSTNGRRRPGDRMSWSCRWPSSPCPVTGTSPSQASTRRSSGCPMRKPNVG